MTRASTATTPSPAGRTMSGLTSSSAIVVAGVEGETLHRHDRVDDGVDVAGGSATRASEQRGTLRLVDHGAALRLGERRHAERHVVEHLGEDATRPVHDRGPERRLVREPEDHLGHRVGDHRLDDHAVDATRAAPTPARVRPGCDTRCGPRAPRRRRARPARGRTCARCPATGPSSPPATRGCARREPRRPRTSRRAPRRSGSRTPRAAVSPLPRPAGPCPSSSTGSRGSAAASRRRISENGLV